MDMNISKFEHQKKPVIMTIIGFFDSVKSGLYPLPIF